MSELTQNRIAWAAGLFEGEGCITGKTVGFYFYPIASLQMDDEDVVRRFHKIVGVGRVIRRDRTQQNQIAWAWQVQDRKGFDYFISLIEPYLGVRRKEKLQAVLLRAKLVRQERLANAG